MKILWIEKYDDYIDFYLERLELPNLDVLKCTNFDDAIRILNRSSIDLIISCHNTHKLGDSIEFKSVFEFYNELTPGLNIIPFIVYSDFMYQDPMFHKFNNIDNLFLVAKVFETSNLRSIISLIDSSRYKKAG